MAKRHGRQALPNWGCDPSLPAIRSHGLFDAILVAARRHASNTGSGLKTVGVPRIRNRRSPQLIQSDGFKPNTKERNSIFTSVGRPAKATHRGCPSRESMPKTRMWAPVTDTPRSHVTEP